MIEILLDMLAAARLTRLVTTDELTRPARTAVLRWAYSRQRDVTTAGEAPDDIIWGWLEADAPEHIAPKLATLVTCPWCAGMWCALVVVVLRRVPGWRGLRDALALSQAVGLAHQAEAKLQ